MIRRTSSWLIRVMLRSCLGEKQITRHVPGSPSATRRPRSTRSDDTSGRRAAKSLVNTKVSS